jgi:hypothetical protein
MSILACPIGLKSHGYPNRIPDYMISSTIVIIFAFWTEAGNPRPVERLQSYHEMDVSTDFSA